MIFKRQNRQYAKGIVEEVRVCVMQKETVNIRLNGAYEICRINQQGDGKRETANDTYSFGVSDFGEECEKICFNPKEEKKCSFNLADVEIGIGFHWNEFVALSYRGAVEMSVYDGKIEVVNRLGIEDYIHSVIGSEMAVTCPIELLKAHAIISRTWLVSQLQRKAADLQPQYRKKRLAQTDGETIKIWDVSGHARFDVCSDDHCQRYQGINTDEGEDVAKAIEATRGMVLKYNGAICDARFSKCCGGISELFSTCWTDEDYGYLSPVRCNAEKPKDTNHTGGPSELRDWVANPPTDPYCATTDNTILSRILKSYDQKTIGDFYRWTVKYSEKELSKLIAKKLGTDLGKIISLNPIEIGPSGRIKKLEILGTKGAKVIGKELMIRRTLSETHLLSSAFIVEKTFDGNEHSFALKGAGWGHGVGLCQIGAAVMAEKGHKCEEILALYYQGAEICKIENK